MQRLASLLACLCIFIAPIPAASAAEGDRPNILFAFADDWGYPDAAAYGQPGVKTPTFDRVAAEGVLFTRAFVSSPSCTPSRGAILTGQDFWRLGPGANLWSSLPADLPVYPALLEQAGYFVGHTGKGWGPGRLEPAGRESNPAGPAFQSFDRFLDQRPDGRPFCFWFGSSDPHRPYDDNLRERMGIDPDDITVPPALPDTPAVRRDLANYHAEVTRFDRQVGRLLDRLDELGELDNTIVVISGDHGMPSPRAKTNLYDFGARVPLAIRWPRHVPPGRTLRDFVNLTDLAPTFLEAAGVDIPDQMTGRSLLTILRSDRSGWVDPDRKPHVVIGRERHTTAQAASNPGGYPSRAIRTDRYLYIRNFAPDRWPAGTPDHQNSYEGKGWLGDCDNGPAKFVMWANRGHPAVKPLYRAAFAKRPAEELYDLKTDPHQMHNVADDPAYEATRQQLADKLEAALHRRNDPRIRGEGEKFDQYPYYGGVPGWPGRETFIRYQLDRETSQ